MFCLSHWEPEAIAADYELSEQLGREIEAAGCEPLAELPAEHKASWFRTSKTRFAVVDGEIEIRTEVLVERIR